MLKRPLVTLLGLCGVALMAAGCGSVEQSTACAEFVACIEARDLADGTATDLDRYRADGDCWGSEAGATLCDRSCESGMAFLRDRYSGLPAECAP